MLRNRTDWGGNIAAYLLMVLVNFLANAVPLGGQTTGEISAKYPSLFTPAGFTFAIWGVIYLALAGFVCFQALPSRRNTPELARIDGLFKANCAANALWIFAWHYDLLWLSLLLMACILLSLVAMYRRLGIVDPALTGARRWLIQVPVSLYTGWISVAAIANVSAVQTAMGWDDVATSAVNWALIKLALAAAVAAAVIVRRGDSVFALVIAWAAFGISIGQAATPAVAGAASMLALLALMLASAEAVRRRQI